MAGTKAGAAKRIQAQKAVSLTKEGPSSAVQDPVYVVAPKRVLSHRGKILQAGEVVPEAHLWPRVESWVMAGRIVRV